MIYFKHGVFKNLYPLASYVYDCDPWPSDHRAVITEFSICKNSPIVDINVDEIINILDVIMLVSEFLESSNKYCIYNMVSFSFVKIFKNFTC